MAEKFLVIGDSSFYGSNFIKLLEAKGESVTKLSLRDWLPEHLFDSDPDYIVNFAAANIVAQSWKDPLEYIDCNVIEHSAIFSHLQRHKKLKKYVHVSTPEVYGTTEGWVDETYSKWEPTTPYAVTRAAGDMMLMAYQKAHKLPAVITRTANIYGPGQPDHRIIPATIKKIREGKKLGLDGGGKSVRCFIHVKDACEATYKVAKQGSPGQTYHISTNHQIKIYDLVKKICTLMGKRMEDVVEQTPERLGKDFAYLLKSERIRNMGWRDTITLDRGLQECASYLSR